MKKEEIIQIKREIETFDKRRLHHVEIRTKTLNEVLSDPSMKVLDEIESFDKTKLHHVSTKLRDLNEIQSIAKLLPNQITPVGRDLTY
jgi:hypothetical protein